MSGGSPNMQSKQPAYQPPWPPRQQQAPQGAISAGGVVLTVFMWIAWFGVLVVADLMGFMMFAFADAPGSGRAAQMMIVPAFVWFGITFALGVILLLRRRWWRIVLAFVLAGSPPFLIFAGYNLLMGGGRSSGSAGSGGYTTTNPAPSIHTPKGGFAPAPMKLPDQPDFQKTIEKYSTTRPATQP